jgi:hypothetical protein
MYRLLKRGRRERERDRETKEIQIKDLTEEPKL